MGRFLGLAASIIGVAVIVMLLITEPSFGLRGPLTVIAPLFAFAVPLLITGAGFYFNRANNISPTLFIAAATLVFIASSISVAYLFTQVRSVFIIILLVAFLTVGLASLFRLVDYADEPKDKSYITLSATIIITIELIFIFFTIEGRFLGVYSLVGFLMLGVPALIAFLKQLHQVAVGRLAFLLIWTGIANLTLIASLSMGAGPLFLPLIIILIVCALVVQFVGNKNIKYLETSNENQSSY